jgi:hypothetical protein
LPTELYDQTFQDLVRKKQYDQAAAWLEKTNATRPFADRWRIATFVSPLFYTGDHVTRLLVYVPGDIEKWIAFQDGGTAEDVNMVAYDHTIPKSPPVVCFSDYYQDPNGQKGYHLQHDSKGISHNCEACHKNGPNSVEPEKTSDLGASVIYRMNETMARNGSKYGPPVFCGGLDPTKLGPAFGDEQAAAASLKTDDGLFSHCTKAKGEKLKKIADAISCNACHSDNGRAKFRYPFGDAAPELNFRSLVELEVMHFRKMPIETYLEDDERKDLVQCLFEQYMGNGTYPGLFWKWLAEPSCPSGGPQNENQTKGAAPPAGPAGG